jgi:asparagine synthetase B (glutamine-hydrolysing)
MCGIAGFVIDGVDATAASAAFLDALTARGRDGSWSAVRGHLPSWSPGSRMQLFIEEFGWITEP